MMLGVATPPDFQYSLAPRGAIMCNYGEQVAQADCSAAVDLLTAKLGATQGRPMQVWGATRAGFDSACGSWGSVPAGCSMQVGGDYTAHFKPPSTPATGCNTDGYQLVCAAPLLPSPPPPSPSPPPPSPSPPTPTAPVVCGRVDYCPSEAAGLKKVDELHEVRLQHIHPSHRARLSADCASLPAASSRCGAAPKPNSLPPG